MAHIIEPSAQSSTGRRRAWTPAHLAQLTSKAMSPGFAFVDTHTAPEETFVIAGSGRSGTTWMAELLNPGDRRTIWEPFNTMYSPLPAQVGFHWGNRVAPEERAPELERMVERVLSGRIRTRWTDHNNHTRVATRRLVKTVATTNLVPWLHEHFPEVHVIYALRHPFAFAESHLALDWPGMDLIHAELVAGATEVIGALPSSVRTRVHGLDLEPADEFERYVVRWCLENADQLHSPTPGVLRVHYEHLVLDTRGELDRIGGYLGLDYGDDAMRRARVPSTTDFRHSVTSGGDGTADALVAGWTRSVDADRRAAGLRILDAFGLAGVYDASPVPVG